MVFRILSAYSGHAKNPVHRIRHSLIYKPVFLCYTVKKRLILKEAIMNQDTKKRIRLLYGIVLSAMLVAVGFLLMAACLQIYLSGGEQIYTPQKVATAFGRIAVPVYICLGLIVVGFVLHLLLWQAPGKDPKIKHPVMQLRRLQLTRDISQADDEKQAALGKLRSRRLALQLILLAVCILCTGIFGFFALTNSVFFPEPAQATAYVVSLMPVFAPCTAVALCYGVVTVYLARRNVEKQIALFKQCPPLPQHKSGKQTGIRIVRYAVLVLALAACVYGLATGGWQDVLTKAVNICTECVGLG